MYVHSPIHTLTLHTWVLRHDISSPPPPTSKAHKDNRAFVMIGTPDITDRTTHLNTSSAWDVQVSGPGGYDRCSYRNNNLQIRGTINISGHAGTEAWVCNSVIKNQKFENWIGFFHPKMYIVCQKNKQFAGWPNPYICWTLSLAQLCNQCFFFQN